ncbi:hypothetical protein EJ08DRAFT_366074 [Tothia fuscella]|uniref:Uncharacterized protein n=1 Tax=Tothia fuscella TaxID=1048955 RepID=A0A9P4TWK2_9PEZI|nr:hypothetical protein EJ08DRAFT_366074 [Tothia fuscella]
MSLGTLGRLPPEIRNIIYEHVASDGLEILNDENRVRRNFSNWNQLAPSYVSRATHDEYISVYQKSAHAILTIGPRFDQHFNTSKWKKMLGRIKRRRSVTRCVCVTPTSLTIYLHGHRYWEDDNTFPRSEYNGLRVTVSTVLDAIQDGAASFYQHLKPVEIVYCVEFSKTIEFLRTRPNSHFLLVRQVFQHCTYTYDLSRLDSVTFPIKYDRLLSDSWIGMSLRWLIPLRCQYPADVSAVYHISDMQKVHPRHISLISLGNPTFAQISGEERLEKAIWNIRYFFRFHFFHALGRPQGNLFTLCYILLLVAFTKSLHVPHLAMALALQHDPNHKLINFTSTQLGIRPVVIEHDDMVHYFRMLHDYCRSCWVFLRSTWPGPVFTRTQLYSSMIFISGLALWLESTECRQIIVPWIGWSTTHCVLVSMCLGHAFGFFLLAMSI